MDPTLIIVALISVIGTIIVALIGVVPLILPLMRRTKAIAEQITPNGGDTDTLGDRIVRTERHAQTASRLAGEAAVRSDVTAQELNDYRNAHEAEAAASDQRLVGIEAKLDEVSEAAAQAVTAAGLAVNEAKAGRATLSEAAERSRSNVDQLRQMVSGLATAIEADEAERRKKEQAYVAALNKLGVPLTPITDELDGIANYGDD